MTLARGIHSKMRQTNKIPWVNRLPAPSATKAKRTNRTNPINQINRILRSFEMHRDSQKANPKLTIVSEKSFHLSTHIIKEFIFVLIPRFPISSIIIPWKDLLNCTIWPWRIGRSKAKMHKIQIWKSKKNSQNNSLEFTIIWSCLKCIKNITNQT